MISTQIFIAISAKIPTRPCLQPVSFGYQDLVSDPGKIWASEISLAFMT
jgi:hypothetical protein